MKYMVAVGAESKGGPRANGGVGEVCVYVYVYVYVCMCVCVCTVVFPTVETWGFVLGRADVSEEAGSPAPSFPWW